jgi:hypothetical protein
VENADDAADEVVMGVRVSLVLTGGEGAVISAAAEGIVGGLGEGSGIADEEEVREGVETGTDDGAVE